LASSWGSDLVDLGKLLGELFFKGFNKGLNNAKLVTLVN